MVCFSSEPIDPKQVYDLIGKDSAGSVLFHFAVAKADTAKHGVITHITYQPNGDVEQNLRDIAAEMQEKGKLTDVLLIRRQGTIEVGEIISLVAVSSPSSEAAFTACRHGLDCMKQMPTIIKTET